MNELVDGAWSKLDLSLQETPGGWTWTDVTGVRYEFPAVLSASTPVIIGSEDGSMSSVPSPMPSKEVQGILEGNSITYPDAVTGGHDLVYTVSGAGVLEQVLLEKEPIDPTFRFAVTTQGYSIEPNAYGGLDVTASGEQVGTISTAVAYDSSPEAASDTASYELSALADGEYELSLVFDPAYFAAATYPVVIEPVLNREVSPHRDGYVQQSTPTTNYESNVNLKVGSGLRSFLRFDMTDFSQADRLIYDASLFLYPTASGGVTGGVAARRVTQDAPDPGTLNWNNQPNVGSNDLDVVFQANNGNWWQWQLKELYQHIIDPTNQWNTHWANYGVRLSASNAKTFYATEAAGTADPVLYLSWNDLPYSFGLDSPANNYVTETESPTLRAEFIPNDPNGDDVLISFQISDDGTNWSGSHLVFQSPYDDRKSFTVPGGILVDGQEYWWRAVARDVCAPPAGLCSLTDGAGTVHTPTPTYGVRHLTVSLKHHGDDPRYAMWSHDVGNGMTLKVNEANGNAFLDVPLDSYPTPLGLLEVGLTYNHQVTANYGLGPGWDVAIGPRTGHGTLPNRLYKLDSTSTADVKIVFRGGRVLYFPHVDGNVYGGTSANSGWVRKTSSDWIYVDGDGGRFTFGLTAETPEGARLKSAKPASSQSAAPGKSIDYAYNASNQLTSVTDPLGRKIVLTWSSGRLQEITAWGGTPEASFSSYEFEQFWNLGYDSSGRLSSVSTIVWTYDGLDDHMEDLTFMYVPSGQTGTGALAEIRDAAITYQEATGWRLTYLTDPNGLKRVSTITPPPGGAPTAPSPWHFAYHAPYKGSTAAGACITDPRGTPSLCDAETVDDFEYETQVEFSWAGLPIEVISPYDQDGVRGVTTYVFDDHLNLLCERSPVANAWGNKHCTSATDANGSYTDLDPDGRSTRYFYGSVAPWRLNAVTHPAPAEGAPRLQESYTYDSGTSSFNGLWAEIYDVSNLADLPNDEYMWSDLDQAWGGGNPPGAGGSDSFSIRLTGYLDVADWTGPRTTKFRVWSNDGVSLTVGSSTILDCFGEVEVATEYNCGTNQDAKKQIWPGWSGLVPFEIEFSHLSGDASLTLRWDGGGGSFIVPAASRFQPNLGLVTTKTYQKLEGSTTDLWEESWTYPTDDRKARRLPEDHHRRALPTGPDYATRTTYNSYGQPLTITEHLGTTEAATTTNMWVNGASPPNWDVSGTASCLSSTTDPTGAVSTFECAPDGDVYKRSQSIRAVGSQPAQTRVTRLAYDSLGRLELEQGPSGERAITSYDLAGRRSQIMVEITPGVFAVTDYTHDDAGHLLNETMPDPDRSGPLTRSVVSHTWNWSDLETSMTDARGKTWTTAYDALDRPISRTSPLGATSSTTYMLGSEVNYVFEQAPSGATVTTEYDLLGREQWVQLENYGLTSYLYDVLGNVTLTEDPAGIQTKSTFNGLSELTSTTEFFGTTSAATSTYDYDAAGRLEQVDGPRSSPDDRITYDYDLVGRLTSSVYEGVTLPSSATKARVDITYDDAGERVRTSQPLTTSTTMVRNWTYDASGTTATYVDARGTTTFTHNLVGWPIQVSDPRPQTVHIGYDDLGRTICRHTATCDQTTAAAETYAYDPAGNLTKAKNPAATFDITYDDDGRLWKTFRDGSPTPETTYNYNSSTGLLASIADAAGTTAFTYNGADQVLTVDDPFVGGAPVSTYAYDGAGRISTRTDAQANLQWTRTYEPNTGRLDTQLIKNHTSGATLASFDLGYDAAGNVTSKASNVFSNPANGTWGYVYDGASRLVQATGPNATGAATTYDYAYDGGGNRILAKETTGSVVKNLTTSYDAAGLPTAATDAATGESITYTHDAIGNLKGIDSSIAANDWTYTFDPYSRLTCAVQGSSCASGNTRVLFTLDALDRAITRAKGSSTTSLTYRGVDESIAKTVNGSTTTLYASTAEGTPLGEKTGSTSSFYLADPHGDVVGLASTGAANQGTAAFDPWGRGLATTGQTSFLGYQGDMTDADTKQADMGTRWYTGSLGRFTSRDVIFGELGNPMTLNLHVYGGLNPITMWDPTGMYQDDAGGGGGCGLHGTASCNQAIRDNTEHHESHSSSSGGSSSGGSSSAGTVKPRPPRPDPPRGSLIGRMVGTAVDAASATANAVTGQSRWRLNEARQIFNGAGAGFLSGRAVDSWIARSDILRGGALTRGGSLALRGAGGALTLLGAKLRYDQLREEYDAPTAVAGTALSVGAGSAAIAVTGALCATGIGCALAVIGAGFIGTGVGNAIFDWAMSGGCDHYVIAGKGGACAP